MKLLFQLAAGALFLTMAGCATGERISASAPDAAATTPVATPAVFAYKVDDGGPQMNELGGEIPRSSPTDAVGEGGLAEARPDAEGQ